MKLLSKSIKRKLEIAIILLSVVIPLAAFIISVLLMAWFIL